MVTHKTFHESDYGGAETENISLIDGSTSYCSIFHCDPTPVDPALALRFADLAKRFSLKTATVIIHRESFDRAADQYLEYCLVEPMAHGDFRVSFPEYMGLDRDEQALMIYLTGELPD